MESKRLAALRVFVTCPVRKSMVKRAGVAGLIKAETLIKAWDAATYFEFNALINRYFMENSGKEEKAADICNLLSEANGVLYERKVKNKGE